jgi:hypothetical protein
MAIAIQTLEDERTVSYVPLLVLSEEVIFYPHPTLSQRGRAGNEGNNSSEGRINHISSLFMSF